MENESFDKCMKQSFREIGVAPQKDTPAWRACLYVWETAFTAGQAAEREECAKEAEGCTTLTPTPLDEQWDDACAQIAKTIRARGTKEPEPVSIDEQITTLRRQLAALYEQQGPLPPSPRYTSRIKF